jgi:hypothetical protein
MKIHTPAPAGASRDEGNKTNFAMRTREQSQKFTAYKGTFKDGEEANMVKYLRGHKRKISKGTQISLCETLLYILTYCFKGYINKCRGWISKIRLHS